MNAFAKLSELGPLPIWDGVLGRVVEGANVTLALVELAPNSVVPEHQHHNEQLGLVLQGTLRVRIGGERRDIGPGDAYAIPGNVPHDFVTGADGAVVIDVFSPVRADWSRFTPLAPQRPRWP
jgi:quercetin dioxygenase-like cupin family protein